MKIVFYDNYKPGLLRGDEVVDISEDIELGQSGQQTLENLMSDWEQVKGALEKRLASGSGVALQAVQLRAPIPRPGKILCMASNYREGTDLPPRPIRAFLCSPEAVLDPDGTVALPPYEFRICHHEAELVCVIGKKGRNVSGDDAMSYVFGYTAGVDVSPRREDWGFLGKSSDGCKPLGPCIVTADEIDNPHDLQVRLSVDGQLRQDYNTRDMGHPIAECISWFSSLMTIMPGDVLFVGTNHQQLGPLQEGDTAVMEIERIGSFQFHVTDPLKRSWPKGIDAAMAEGARGRIAADAAKATQ